MNNTSHLAALSNNLSSEKARLASAKSQREIELRTVWVKQLEREINSEYEYLGMSHTEQISDDDLLAALAA